ncbi:NAD(P)/FAD-dependent oxidoreductase [Chelatococcus reniformis]|uniref:D-amino-acid oxidase n=1 Tax=Chelatococcus reniformis TaxID=1494448 RepID=A0A916UA00_9HYPH|nr:FAD-dependent oxidoreductase [Chelatococcus reniformis]GGC64837.1 hypothetical protein GCM10010994_24290 [Chelatococcus reniformis]
MSLLIPSRRQFLLACAALACEPPFAWARETGREVAPGRLRGGEILPTADFDQLAPNPYRFGVRPHRRGGVRLERVARPLETPQGPKHLIHNYGHGGGGITLAFGCADVVKGHVERIVAEALRCPAERVSVAVIGAGVIGLAVASELKRWRPQLAVTVYAKNVDRRRRVDVAATTSWVAGGQFEPSGIWREYWSDDEDDNRMEILHDLVARSAARLRQLQAGGTARAYGIFARRNYTLRRYDEDGDAIGSEGFDRGTPRSVIAAPAEGLLPFAQLRAVQGREYRTWLIDPTILLPRLVADLRKAAVRFEPRTLHTVDDVRALPAQIIVNCTGLGAGTLFGDQNVVPIRGQLVILNNPSKIKYFFSGGCDADAAYLFARSSDIVVGGTYEYNEAGAPSDEGAYATILRRATDIFAGRANCVRQNAVI